MVFCTLFDSYYLDKVLVMYKSLCDVTEDFVLYMFCFDDKSYEILNELKLKNVVVLHHTCFENEKLLEIKKERSKPEYCWTCTPIIIEYVLNSCGEAECTYIDSDLFFFSNPQVLFDEIKENHGNVAIMEHGFPNTPRGRRLCKRSGKYCVEFNYFDKSDNAKEALLWWKESCLEWCYHIYESDRMGDQKYLEQFPVRFSGVYVIKNRGGGVAPWNLGKYRLKDTNDGITLIDKEQNDSIRLIFYHFQNMKYLGKNWVNVGSEAHSKRTKDAIYIPYLFAIEHARKELSKRGIEFSNRIVKSSNRVIAFLQGTLLRLKVRSITDFYDLRRIR